MLATGNVTLKYANLLDASLHHSLLEHVFLLFLTSNCPASIYEACVLVSLQKDKNVASCFHVEPGI